jgi:ATP-dependent exoDNAse (exonuclease V) beta subunit
MTGGGLNRAQAQAVRTLSGRLIVDAGAGSGKTRVLAERFANALSGSHSPEWEPVGVDEVVAITFTDKAAGELAERIRRSLRAVGMGDEARRLDAAWISTIHGLCARILRRHAIEAGLDPDARVADDVLAGRIREAAFESAAEAALRSDEGKLLLSAYRYDALFDQVASLAAALRLARAEPRDLETERAADFCGLIAEAKDAFSDARACFCACSPTQKTAVAHAEACARVVMELEELARLEDHGHSEEYLSQKLWSVLDSWSPGRSSRAVEEARDELRERHANLIERAASIAVRPYAKALTELAAEFAERYEQLKREAGVLDFDDLQLKTVALLDKDPRLAARYRSAFKLMMVDEFQDTDRLQLSLIELLSDDNVCTVGDERQSIYGFRGADVSVYREHVERADERGVTRIPLSVNYRSHPAVIEFVNELFGRELLFGERFQNLEAGRLEADPERVDPETPRMGFVFGERVSQSGTPARLAVADAVARRMHALVAAGRFRAGEMAILLRSYRHAADYASALRRHGLSAVVVGGSRFFSLVEVAVMRALTRCIANTQDDEALSLLAASSFSGITADGLWRLRSRVISDRTAMTDALTDAVGLSPNDARCAARLLDSLDVARSLGGRLPLGSVLLAAVEKGEWFGRLLETGDEGQQAIANILKVARLADGFAATGAGAAEFSEYLDAKERLAVHEPPATLVGEDESVVRIMSIHAAKGLEFPVVVLAGLDDSPRADTSIALVDLRAESSPKLAVSLPSSMQDGTRPETRRTQAFAELHEMQAELDRDEAKRLFYVGCTRAEELLILAGTAGAKGPKPDTMLDWLLRATGRSGGDHRGMGPPGRRACRRNGLPQAKTWCGSSLLAGGLRPSSWAAACLSSIRRVKAKRCRSASWPWTPIPASSFGSTG